MLIHQPDPSRKSGHVDNLWAPDPEAVHFCSCIDGIGRAHPFGPDKIYWDDVIEAMGGGFMAHRTDDNRLLMIVPPTAAKWWGRA